MSLSPSKCQSNWGIDGKWIQSSSNHTREDLGLDFTLVSCKKQNQLTKQKKPLLQKTLYEIEGGGKELNESLISFFTSCYSLQRNQFWHGSQRTVSLMALQCALQLTLTDCRKYKSPSTLETWTGVFQWENSPQRDSGFQLFVWI